MRDFVALDMLNPENMWKSKDLGRVKTVQKKNKLE